MRDNDKRESDMKQHYKQYLKDVSEQISHDRQKRKNDSARERSIESGLVREELQAVAQLKELQRSRDKKKRALLEEIRASTVTDRKSKLEQKKQDDAREIERMKQQDEIVSIRNREHLQRKKVVSAERANRSADARGSEDPDGNQQGKETPLHAGKGL